MNIFPVQQHAKIDFQRGLTGYESVNCESSALAQEPWSLCAFTSTISLSTSGTINLFSYCVYVGVCHRLAGWFKLSRVEAFLGEMTPACYWHPWLLSSSPLRWKGLLTAPLFSLFACVKGFPERVCSRGDGGPDGHVCGEGWCQKSSQSDIHQSSHLNTCVKL